MHDSAAPASLAAALRGSRRACRTPRGAHAVTKERRAAGWHLAAAAARHRALQLDGSAGPRFFQPGTARASEPAVLRVQRLPGYLPDDPGDDPDGAAPLAAARAAGAVRADRPGTRHSGHAGATPARLWRPPGRPVRQRARPGAPAAPPRPPRRAPRTSRAARPHHLQP